MKIIEFECHWVGNYSKEEEAAYSVMHGDDRSRWPETNDTTSIFIDIEKIIRFNPHHDENKTTVELHGGYSYSLVIPIHNFIKVLRANDIDVSNYNLYLL